MEITFIRSSSYNCFELCQQQFFLSYILGIEQKPHPKAEKGTIVHKVMEVIANLRKCEQEQKQKGRKYICEDDSIGLVETNDFRKEEFITAIANRSFDYYTNKSPNIFSLIDKEDCVKWSLKAIKLIDQMNIVAAEQRFDIEINEPWAKLPDNTFLRLKGTIDLITRVNDNTYEMVDLKTGRKYNWSKGEEKTHEMIEKDPQLRIYHLALSNLYGKDKVYLLTLNYVNDGGPHTITFTQEDLFSTKEMLRKHFIKVKNTLIPKLKSNNHTHFFCKFVCGYGPKFAKEGVCSCQNIKDEVKLMGINKVIQKYREDNFSVSSYRSPGS